METTECLADKCGGIRYYNLTSAIGIMVVRNTSTMLIMIYQVHVELDNLIQMNWNLLFCQHLKKCQLYIKVVYCKLSFHT